MPNASTQLDSNTPARTAQALRDSPLLAPWTGPYGGVPPFATANLEELEAATKVACADYLSDIDAVANNTDVATFDNTLRPLEAAGQSLDRLYRILEVHTTTVNNSAMQALEQLVTPLIVESHNTLAQNAALFARIETVYRSRLTQNFNPEQLRLVEDYFDDYVSAGATLPTEEKARIGVINQRLSELNTQFSQNLLNSENEQWVELKTEADFAGLPASMCNTFREAAVERELDAPAVVFNTRSAVEPFLEYSSRRDLRARVLSAFLNRGDTGDAFDNKAIIAELLALRAEKARLIGYPTYAHWALVGTMAKSPATATALLDSVWPAALTRAKVEIQELQRVCDAECAETGATPFALKAWDYRYYAEKLRKAKYQFDAEDLRPYLQLEKLLAGVCWLAQELFGLAFTELPVGTVPVVHPDVRVFEVTDQTGTHVGLWYFDAYAREDKESGAWMSEYRSQNQLSQGVTPIVSNNANFSKGRPGEPVLLSWDDALTLFHEFGHGLHGLLSNATYPSLAGTEVTMDFVEFPSQWFENWLSTPQLLQRFAIHSETGAAMPPELIDKIVRSASFMQGCKSIEGIASAMLDIRLHLTGAEVTDPNAFETQLLTDLGMPSAIPIRHRAAHFGHIFSSSNYAATYYSYLWAEQLAADAWEAFCHPEGPLDVALAAQLTKQVLSVGNTRDPAASYHAFRGRDPDGAALMRARGFPV
jgi:peptidyl-dipeptidase Dcp